MNQVELSGWCVVWTKDGATQISVWPDEAEAKRSGLFARLLYGQGSVLFVGPAEKLARRINCAMGVKS